MDLAAFRAGMKSAMTGSAGSIKKPSTLSKSPLSLRTQASPAQLRALLDGIHQRLRSAQTAAPMYDAVDEYVATAAQLALTFQSSGMARGADVALGAGALAAPFVPGGSVLAAAVSSVGNLKSSSGA